MHCLMQRKDTIGALQPTGWRLWGGVPTRLRVGLPYATRLGRRDQLRHGVGSEFGDRLLCRHREGDTQGQTQLDCLP